MAWTTPRTWTTGELVTAAMLNAHVRDNLNALVEVGSFAPVLVSSGGGAPTYLAQTAYWVKAQALFICHFDIQVNAIGSLAAGDLSITGFPHAPVSAGPTFNTKLSWTSFNTSLIDLTGQIAAAATTMLLYRNVAAAPSSYTNRLVQGDIGASSAIRGSVAFRV